MSHQASRFISVSVQQMQRAIPEDMQERSVEYDRQRTVVRQARCALGASTSVNAGFRTQIKRHRCTHFLEDRRPQSS